MTETNWEYTDFVWTPPNPIIWTFSNTKADKIDRAKFLVIKSDAWSDNRAQILQALQKYLNQGWQVFVEIGPDCWETEIKEYTKNPEATKLICYIIICVVCAFIPCLYASELFPDMVDYRLVAFRVQLRRPKSQ